MNKSTQSFIETLTTQLEISNQAVVTTTRKEILPLMSTAQTLFPNTTHYVDTKEIANKVVLTVTRIKPSTTISHSDNDISRVPMNPLLSAINPLAMFSTVLVGVVWIESAILEKNFRKQITRIDASFCIEDIENIMDDLIGETGMIDNDFVVVLGTDMYELILENEDATNYRDITEYPVVLNQSIEHDAYHRHDTVISEDILESL